MDIQTQYRQLEEDLKAYKKLMAQIADTVLDNEVSKYPLFVIHRDQLDLGVLLVDHEDGKSKWSIQSSTLEVLAAKKVIGMDKVDRFRQVFKDPQQFLCLFVLSDMGPSFVFLPREREEGMEREEAKKEV